MVAKGALNPQERRAIGGRPGDTLTRKGKKKANFPPIFLFFSRKSVVDQETP
jgi:hypothetical protein